MVNKITFLGTGGDSFVVGKQIRASGGIVLQIGDLQLHIDPGPGALVRAVENGVNLRANTAVLVSNSSIINCNDVNAVIDAMTYGGLDKCGVLVANQTIVNGTEEIKPYLTNFHKTCLEKIIVLNVGQKVGIEDIEIHAMPTISNDPNAIGFKIFTSEFVLGYTSNTGYSKEIVKAYSGCDILVLNVIAPVDEKVDCQLNSEDAVKLIKAVNPKLAVIQHFGVKMLKADPLYEGREIQKKTGVQILVAKDGMTISPGSYAARSKQKRLNLFKDKEPAQEEEELKIKEPEEPISIIQEEPEEQTEEAFAKPEEPKEEEQKKLDP